jgi:hypothetical protein
MSQGPGPSRPPSLNRTLEGGVAGERSESQVRSNPWPPILLSVGTLLSVVIVASARRMPLSPVPAGPRPLLPFRWMAEGLGLNRLSPRWLGALGIVAVASTGLALLVAVRYAWDGRLSLRTVIATGVVLHALALAMPLFSSHDVYHYAMYGRIASIHHHNPYVAVPNGFRSDPFYRSVTPVWRSAPAFYGPVLIMLFGAVTRFARSASAVVTTFKLISATGSLATMFLIGRVAGRWWPRRAAFAALLFGWSPVVLFDAVAGAHIDTFLAFLIVAALSLVGYADARSGRKRLGAELLATGLLAVVALAKAPAGLPLVAWIIVAVGRRPPRERKRSLLQHIFVVIILVVPFTAPFIGAQGAALSMVRLTRYSNFLAPSSFFRLLFSLFVEGKPLVLLDRLVKVTFPLAFVAALLGILLQIGRRAAELTPQAVGGAWGWASLLFLLSAPILFPWYLLWVLPLAWVLPFRGRLACIALSAVLPLSESAVGDQPGFTWLANRVVLVSKTVIAGALFVVLVWLLNDLRRRLRSTIPLERELAADADVGGAGGSQPLGEGSADLTRR